MSLGALFALFISKALLQRCGKLRSVIWVLCVQSVFVLIFGLAKLFSSNSLFVSVSMICRFVEGLATNFIMSTSMLMITSYFQNYSSLLVADVIGLQTAELIGPLWGALLFQYINYSGIFLI